MKNLYIVDGHNEVLESWRREIKPSVDLVHFDAHSDLNDGVPIEFSNNFSKVEISKFICVAKHLGLIKNIYWFDLRTESIRAFENLKTVVTDGTIRWKTSPKTIFLNQLQFLERLNGEYILDIDLDVFSSIDEEIASEELIHHRLALFKSSITKLAHPSLITIARSQTPVQFVPINQLEKIQSAVIKALAEHFTFRSEL